MSIQEKITSLLSLEIGPEVRNLVTSVGSDISTLPRDISIIPTSAFKVVGIDPERKHFEDNALSEKEYFYFEKCLNASLAFFSTQTEDAIHLLMQAKWDFNEWALAHYLLGLVMLENREFKSALDQFDQALELEPFNTKPMRIFREIAHFLVMHPS